MKCWRYARLVCPHAAALLTLVGCASPPAPQPGLAAEVDRACGGPVWRGRHALAADVTVRRTNRPDLRGVMFYDIRGNRLLVRFPSKSGGQASCGFDGRGLWVDCPFDSDCGDWPMVLQWAACVALPYRLTEPSLRVREVRPISVAGATYRVAELERTADGPGVCALYVERGGLRPRAAVPVCPAGLAHGAVPEAFGFAYDEFSICGDVTVPTRWSIRRWDARDGLSAAGPVASITLHHPCFVYPDPALFDAPRGESTKQFPNAMTPGRSRHLEEASRGAP